MDVYVCVWVISAIQDDSVISVVSNLSELSLGDDNVNTAGLDISLSSPTPQHSSSKTAGNNNGNNPLDELEAPLDPLHLMHSLDPEQADSKHHPLSGAGSEKNVLSTGSKGSVGVLSDESDFGAMNLSNILPSGGSSDPTSDSRGVLPNRNQPNSGGEGDTIDDDFTDDISFSSLNTDTHPNNTNNPLAGFDEAHESGIGQLDAEGDGDDDDDDIAGFNDESVNPGRGSAGSESKHSSPDRGGFFSLTSLESPVCIYVLGHIRGIRAIQGY